MIVATILHEFSSSNTPLNEAKMTFNASNWTGKELTVKINRTKRTLKMYDSTFEFRKNAKSSNVFEVYDVYSTDFHRGEYPIAQVTRYENENWTAQDPDAPAYDGGLSRSDPDMYVAAAKYFANVI
jgi:hypothetical protein